jgi:hypothetical protein
MKHLIMFNYGVSHHVILNCIQCHDYVIFSPCKLNSSTNVNTVQPPYIIELMPSKYYAPHMTHGKINNLHTLTDDLHGQRLQCCYYYYYYYYYSKQ